LSDDYIEDKRNEINTFLSDNLGKKYVELSINEKPYGGFGFFSNVNNIQAGFERIYWIPFENYSDDDYLDLQSELDNRYELLYQTLSLCWSGSENGQWCILKFEDKSEKENVPVLTDYGFVQKVEINNIGEIDYYYPGTNPNQ
jgi:plasmid maintenance system killer protein